MPNPSTPQHDSSTGSPSYGRSKPPQASGQQAPLAQGNKKNLFATTSSPGHGFGFFSSANASGGCPAWLVKADIPYAQHDPQSSWKFIDPDTYVRLHSRHMSSPSYDRSKPPQASGQQAPLAQVDKKNLFANASTSGGCPAWLAKANLPYAQHDPSSSSKFTATFNHQEQT
ncbi:hypothetical protein BJ508DRAFT_336040 [Ascobolus immersus RN42]|uniref:Uncharacterized protein n=1 Tax=Ascobolus immersus RN42 TaxID=1160509 RepID=A0A3N4HA04_ASCIM|nr:hypothetical protein BJ508DRAFT_336040 [Ascobolus immersus RN42]